MCVVPESWHKRSKTQNFVGGWRKDEVQSSALVGDSKDVEPPKLCTSYPSWNVLYLHSSSFTTVLSPVWEGHGGMVLKTMRVYVCVVTNHLRKQISIIWATLLRWNSTASSYKTPRYHLWYSSLAAVICGFRWVLDRPLARILCMGDTVYKWRGTMQMKATLP